MWVVTAKKGLDVHRDELISDLLGEERIEQPEVFVVKPSSSYRYNVSSNLASAKMYKHKASCERLVKKFNNSLKDNNRNSFYWIRDYKLSFRKITSEEWNSMCNDELQKLEKSYLYHKQKIEEKRRSFK
jgi:hypothetical protein